MPTVVIIYEHHKVVYNPVLDGQKLQLSMDRTNKQPPVHDTFDATIQDTEWNVSGAVWQAFNSYKHEATGRVENSTI